MTSLRPTFLVVSSLLVAGLGCGNRDLSLGSDDGGVKQGSGGASSAAGGSQKGGASSTQGGATLEGGSPGSGGATLEGGSPGSGGATLEGGSPGSGGATLEGGSPGSGGATLEGGSPGSGGATLEGGSPGSGGATLEGGSPGSGGATLEGGSGGATLCDPSQCGPEPGIGNFVCPDGNVSGPTGRCIETDGGCGWEIVGCPCADTDCKGPRPGAPNTQCDDGSLGGPVCTPDASGTCGWELRQCPDGGGGAGGASGVDCDELQKDVAAKLAAAQACNAKSASPVAQCQGTVEGFCCDVLVADPQSAATQQYLDALHDYEKTCAASCKLEIACHEPTIGDCEAPAADGVGACGGGDGYLTGP